MISNSDKFINSRDVIERIEELEDQLVDRWVAGWNMPGYMPDSDPAEFDDFDDAARYIADEMDNQADLVEENWDQTHEDEPCEEAEEIRKTAEHVRNLSEGEYGETVDNYHYFITQDGQMGLDEDDLQELNSLKDLQEEGEAYIGGWGEGVALIRDDRLPEYALELAMEIGAIEDYKRWPCNHIDWKAAAEELKINHASVDFDGETYWVRM